MELWINVDGASKDCNGAIALIAIKVHCRSGIWKKVALTAERSAKG